MTVKWKKLLFIFLLALFLALLAVLCSLVSEGSKVFANGDERDVYKNFLCYDGSEIDYRADVYYNKIVNSAMRTTYTVELVRTLCTDNSAGSDLWVEEDFKVTLITPDGNRFERPWYSWEWQGKDRKLTQDKHEETDISGVLFGSYYFDYNGTYTVEASGRMTGGTSIEQNTSFSFVVDTVAPTGMLNGVSDGGLTNSDVAFTWTESGASATLDGQRYVNGSKISSEGKHSITIKDVAGNSRVYSFEIDKTAPVGMLSGVENEGYTNGNVTFAWTESEAMATLNGQPYAKNSVVKEEGEYIIKLYDKASNFNTYKFIIDKTAPTGTLNGVAIGGVTGTNVTFTWSESSVTATLDGGNYTAGKTISEEGPHTIELTDLANNKRSYSFTVDKTPPTVDGFNQYSNSEVTMTAQDNYSGIEKWEYRLNGGATQVFSGQSVTFASADAASDGVWQVRVYDGVGNVSEWSTVYHVYRTTFGNSENIYNSFSVPSYYTVTLSQKNYADSYGTYTFAEYESALSFAVAKEWDCRVIPLDGGQSWNYVTVSNENARQIYTDVNELNTVINVYATRNVSARQILGKNGTNLRNPTDENGITRPDALTRQIKELPDILSDYASLKFMLASADYTLTAPQRIVDGNNSRIWAQYVSDGISLRIGTEVELAYGAKLSAAAHKTEAQGWYLIRERDVCGNEERYLIFIDKQQPELNAEVSFGDREREIITFNQGYIEANAATMRYLSFDIKSVADTFDDCLMLSIEGRSLNGVYVLGDKLPVLSLDNGYQGSYTITAYDRSHNAVVFEVYIAGENPSLSHTSLTSDTSCRFTVKVNDSFNEIVDVKLFKQLFDGSEERLYVDSFGNEVGAQNLEYRFDVGGKYIFEFTDLYGRTVRSEPLFYLKGLPTATFRGVREGGLTKSDVSVIYNLDVTSELYVLTGSEWVQTSRYTVTQGLNNNTLSIAASAATSAAYKVLLYLTADKNLFSEYVFEIDAIPPVVEIFNDLGEQLAQETVTARNFFVTWSESGYRAYYKRQGALSESNYSRGTRISTAGMYLFTFVDGAKNELSFSITLDNSVSYSLDGTYTLLDDGSYLTNSSFIFTLTEPWSLFQVEASNGLSITNGQRLDVDGTYKITAQDNYGNLLTLTLIVDKLPPIPVIETESGQRLNVGERTKEAFKVFCEEESVLITYSFGSGSYVAYDGRELNDVGTYAFRLTDRGGNVANVTVLIDRDVQFNIEGAYVLYNGAYQFRQWARVVPQEKVTVFNITNERGESVDAANRITDEGIYTVFIVDAAKNELTLTVIIDKTVAKFEVITESGTELFAGDTTNEAFKVVCEEENTKIRYTCNGSASKDYDGGWLTEVGYYLFTVTDFLGNKAEVGVTLNTSVSVLINGNYQIDEVGRYVSRSWLSVTAKEEMSEMYVQSPDGTRIGADVRINVEGVYTLYARDLYGNELTQILVIDTTSPVIELEGVTDGGATNSTVNVHIDDFARAYYQFNGGNAIELSEHAEFSKEGSYVLTAQDFIGNSVRVVFSIDLHVEVKPSVPLVDGQIIANEVSFLFGEEVTAQLTLNGVEGAYKSGALKKYGNYSLTVQDAVGNVEVFRWTILPAKAQNYKIAVSDGVTISATLNGTAVVLQVNDGTVALEQAGVYILDFDDGNSGWTVTLEVDTVPPEVVIESTKKSVVISSPNKEGLTYELYRDGKPVSFNMSASKNAELTAKGSYRLLCIDEVGNVTEYTFKIEYLGDVTKALIAVVSVFVAVAIIVLLIFGLRRRKF